MFWLLIVSHLLCAIGGALVYWKNQQFLEMLRSQFDILVGLFRR